MKKNIWVLALIGSGMLTLAIAPSGSFAKEGHEHGSSALVEEMMVLDNVFRDVVSAVALGDGARAHKSLEAMHGTMEKTHEGVHEGTVHLRKNAGRLKEFIELDKTFHARLETLAQAAQKNDRSAMLSLTKELLDRCVGCHRDFR